MWCEGFCGVVLDIFLIISAVVILHYVYLLWNSDYWKKKGVFCPDSKALFGNLPGQVNGKKNILYELDDLYREYRDKFPYIGIYNFREPRLLIMDPEVIKDITIKYFKYFQGTELYGRIDEKSDPLFGNHPFLQVGEKWKSRRNELTPAFTNSRIKAIFPITHNVNERMVNFIKREVEKPDHDGFDVKELAARFTFSIVSNSIYNIDAKVFEGEDSEILKLAQSFTAPTKSFMIAFMVTTVYPFVRKFWKMSFSKPGAADFFIGLMEKSLRSREELKIQRVDYLDHLMNLRKKREISDNDIASHGASFLVDGFDTSSSVIASALYEIAKNKVIQEKLRDEINQEIQNDEDFTYDKILSLPYLDQVWNECLRLHGPATHLSRYCNEAVTVDMPKDKKIFFEEGSVLYLPIYSIHTDPEYYPNPKKFDPERFSPENGGTKAYADRGVFLPFGLGPRICPGNRFAYAQSKIAIARLIKDFEVSVNPKTPKTFELHPQAIIYTLPECYLEFKEIKN